MSNPTAETEGTWCCKEPALKTVTTDLGVVSSCERCSGHWFLYNSELTNRSPGKDFYKPIRKVSYE